MEYYRSFSSKLESAGQKRSDPILELELEMCVIIVQWLGQHSAVTASREAGWPFCLRALHQPLSDRTRNSEFMGIAAPHPHECDVNPIGGHTRTLRDSATKANRLERQISVDRLLPNSRGSKPMVSIRLAGTAESLTRNPFDYLPVSWCG